MDIAVPFIAVNDGIGASGSRSLAEPLDAIVAIENNDGRFCSGTLIAPNVVLTARHCDVSVGDQVVFGDNLANPDLSVGVQSISLPSGPEDGEEFLDGGDVAFVTLDSNVPDQIATPLRLIAQTDSLVGSVATIAGYGLNGVGSVGNEGTSYGFRWAGQNVIDLYGVFGGGQNLFFADFDDGSDFGNVLGSVFGSNHVPLEYEALVTMGDSGSPLLAEVDGELVVAAVTTGGLDLWGQYGSFAFWTGIERFQQQLSNVGGSFVDDLPPDQPGGGGGNNGDLPSSDDHSNSIHVGSTALDFDEGDPDAIARKAGNIGFGDFTIDQDVFKFVTLETGRIIVDAKALSSDLDTHVQFFDSNGMLIEENDDSGQIDASNHNDSQIFLRNVPAGEYFVSVSGSSGTVGAYRIGVRTTASTDNAQDPGDSFVAAERVSLNPFGPTTYLRSTIETAIVRDFYQFTANRSGTLVVRTNAVSGDLNSVLRGFDSERNVLDKNNNFQDTLDSRIRFDVVSGESYFLNLDSVSTTHGDYRISLRLIADNNSPDNLPFTSFSNSAAGTDLAVPGLDRSDANATQVLAANIG